MKKYERKVPLKFDIISTPQDVINELDNHPEHLYETFGYCMIELVGLFDWFAECTLFLWQSNSGDLKAFPFSSVWSKKLVNLTVNIGIFWSCFFNYAE